MGYWACHSSLHVGRDLSPPPPIYRQVHGADKSAVAAINRALRAGTLICSSSLLRGAHRHGDFTGDGTGICDGDRQCKDETRPTVGNILGPDAASMRLDNGFDDGETEATAAGTDLPCAVGTIETVKDAGQGIGGNAFAAICHGDHEQVPRCIASIVTVPPDGVWRSALSQRFENTRESISGSACSRRQGIGKHVARLYVFALKFRNLYRQYFVNKGSKADWPEVQALSHRPPFSPSCAGLSRGDASAASRAQSRAPWLHNPRDSG